MPCSGNAGAPASRGDGRRGAADDRPVVTAARRANRDAVHFAMKKPPGNPAARIEHLREEAAGCRDCPLWENATQTVFGDGDARAKVMLVGEQPGDQEDRTGHPFVGPAGRILDQALAEAGIPRAHTYVTNAVKHFKWEPRGKRRLHKTPAQREVDACRQWLEREIATVQPAVVVCLGATAAKSLLGPRFRISQERGTVQRREGLPDLVPTFHPSYLLRLKGRAGEEEAHAQFVSDLELAARYLKDKSDR
jgi:DNA polymerase